MDSSIPAPAVIMSSAAFWLLASLVVGLIANRLPESWLNNRSPHRTICMHPSGRRRSSVWRWTNWIPDAGPALPGGIAKASLVRRDPMALHRLVIETRRAELVHAVLWTAGLLTALWLPAAAVLVNLLFACLFNLPCLLIQRVTRERVQRLIDLHLQHRPPPQHPQDSQ